MSAFCADIGTPTPGPSPIGGDSQVGVTLTEDRSMLLGVWELPAGSHLTLKGEAASLAVGEGVDIVVSCGAPLQYATVPGTEPDNELPADMGLAVDPSFSDGIFLSFDKHPGTVAIVAQDEVDSLITLQVAGSPEDVEVCTVEECWDWNDAPLVGTVAICGWIRCP